MKPVVRIGMDTSKSVFQLHGVDDAEEPVIRRQLRRREMIKFFETTPPLRLRSKPVAAHITGGVCLHPSVTKCA